MRSAQLMATSQLSFPEDSYVYQILPVGSHLAAISSDDSLRLIDPATLRATPRGDFTNVHAGVTSVRTPKRESDVLITSGRDGRVKGWDVRTGAQTTSFQTDSNAPYLSLACNDALVAAGTELTNHRAAMSIWDYRNPLVPMRQYVESHNDDITELAFHPSNSHILLSGSTDSLINVYDTMVADEDEVLINITNHGSSIHHAGFLSLDSFFGLSHDESFSLYRLESSDKVDEEVTGPERLAFGDLRGVLNCEYVVDVVGGGDVGSAVVCAGSHSRQCLNLVPLKSMPGVGAGFDEGNVIRLEGAHGEEIIRSLCFGDNVNRIVFTAGEDGHVKAWRMPSEASEAENLTTVSHKSSQIFNAGIDEKEDLHSRSASGKKTSGRFKPY